MLTVEDEDGNSIPFSSAQREFVLPFEGNKQIKLFIMNNGKKMYKVCTWARANILDGAQQKLLSGVCVRVSVQYFQ